jgi:hypothetical protein
VYRIGVYTTADEYLVIKTIRDNQTLLKYGYAVCARNEYIPRFEYAPEGEDFENTPDKKIKIKDGFWKDLPVPEYVPDKTPTYTSITVTPSSATVVVGTTKQFTAVVNGTNSPSQMVTWSVSGNTSTSTIIANGLLTVGSNETATTLTVKVTSVVDASVSKSVTVTVRKQQYTVTFDKNGGSGTAPSSQNVDVGSGFTIPSSNLSKTDYKFGGWLDTSSGMTYRPGSYYRPSRNTMLQAKWILAKQTISWNVGNPRIGDKSSDFRTDWKTMTLDFTALKDAGCSTVSLTWSTYWAECTNGLDCTARVILDCADKSLNRGGDWTYYDTVINPGAGWKSVTWNIPNATIDLVAARPNIRCAYGLDKHETSGGFLGIGAYTSYYDLSGEVTVTVTAQ